LVDIANAFYNAQMLCSNGAAATAILPPGYPTNDYNTDPVSNAPRTYTTPGEPKRLRITGMSLPWGGLNECKTEWTHPHSSHSTGKVADLSWKEFQLPVTPAVGAAAEDTWNMDLVYLLGAIVLNTPGASMPASWEGGDLDTTLQHFLGQPVKSKGGKTIEAATVGDGHFHVQFAS
jgi:hypothetical protein